jgi:hypothetical protein
MAASTQPLWLPKEGIQSGNQSGYEGQQTLVAAVIPKSGSTNIALSKLFSNSPKVLLGITSL